MGIPFRARSPVHAPTAPRSAVAPALGNWQPTPLKMSRGVKVLQFAPRLGRLNPGWLIAGVLADLAIREASYSLMMWLNGLVLKQTCAFLPTDSWSGNQLCSTGQGRGRPMGELYGHVAGLSAGAHVSLLGFTNMSGGINWRGRVTRIYNVVANKVPNQRPWVGVTPPAGNVWARAPISVAATRSPPGRVPFDVRPWPVGKHGNPPIGPQPVPDSSSVPGIQGMRWSWASFGRTAQVENIRSPTAVRDVAKPWEKEVKIGANTAAGQFFFTLMRARENVSELQDFVGVMFDSLPKHTQYRYGGARASEHDQLRAVIENLENIDAGLFLKNLIANQLEDEIIGRTWIAARGKFRNALFGDVIGSTGPLATPAFKNYAKAVSDLSKMLADDLLGKQSYNHDRKLGDLLKRAENALRNLANQSPPRGRAIPPRNA